MRWDLLLVILFAILVGIYNKSASVSQKSVCPNVRVITKTRTHTVLKYPDVVAHLLEEKQSLHLVVYQACSTDPRPKSPPSGNCAALMDQLRFIDTQLVELYKESKQNDRSNPQQR